MQEQLELLLTLDSLGIHHRIIEFICEIVDDLFATDLLIGKQVGQHLQEVRFTTSEEAGNPYAHIIGRHIKRITVIVEEGNEMFFQFSGDDILSQFLLDNLVIRLVNLNDTTDSTVNVISEHILDYHSTVLSSMAENAR